MSEEEKRKLEMDYLNVISDALNATKEAIEKKVGGTWILDGGLGDWLEKAGKVYDALMEIEVKD